MSFRHGLLSISYVKILKRQLRFVLACWQYLFLVSYICFTRQYRHLRQVCWESISNQWKGIACCSTMLDASAFLSCRQLSLADIVKQLRRAITGKSVTVSVRRECVLEDTLRYLKKPNFDPANNLKARHYCSPASFHYQRYVSFQIDFLGESAIDTGGPLREFWRILGCTIGEKMFVGYDDSRKTLILSTDALLVRVGGDRNFRCSNAYFTGTKVFCNWPGDGHGSLPRRVWIPLHQSSYLWLHCKTVSHWYCSD